MTWGYGMRTWERQKGKKGLDVFGRRRAIRFVEDSFCTAYLLRLNTQLDTRYTGYVVEYSKSRYLQQLWGPICSVLLYQAMQLANLLAPGQLAHTPIQALLV